MTLTHDDKLLLAERTDGYITEALERHLAHVADLTGTLGAVLVDGLAVVPEAFAGWGDDDDRAGRRTA